MIGSGGSFDKARMALSPGTRSCRFSGNDSGYNVTGVGNAARVIAGASGEWCRGGFKSGGRGMANGHVIEWNVRKI